ncbi:hypothetical protein [Streptomyces sp. NPDC048508]|uniref:hypothetical protein n=1 Tax=Streptomyces sp. NPDC048508 TaxID=3365561 RepID=UPI00372206A7
MNRRASRARRFDVRSRNITSYLVGLCGVLALSACSSSGGGRQAEAAPSTTSTVVEGHTRTKASKGPDALAKDELLAAYRRYLDEITKAYAQADVAGTDVSKYASGNALVTVQSETKALKNADRVITGELTSTPEVTMIDLERRVPRATVTDCIDVAQWNVIDRDSKNKVAMPAERLLKYVEIVSMEKWGKQWVVLKDMPQERKC